MTVATGTTYRLPDWANVPDGIPLQIALPDMWTAEDLDRAQDTLAAWHTVAGQYLMRSQAAHVSWSRFLFRQQAEDVAAVTVGLAEEVHRQMTIRVEGL